MSRRKVNDAKNGIILVILAYVIPAIILAVYIGSIAYGFLLVLPCLYYAIFGKKKIDDSKEFYEEAYRDCYDAWIELEQAERSYAGLSITNSGRYDERSYKGKAANANLSRLNALILERLNLLNSLISPYANTVFTHIALYLYFACVFILYFYDFNTKFIPFIAFLVSITGALIARSHSVVRVKNNELIPRNLPRITNFSSLLLLGVWVIGASFTYYNMIRNDINEMPFMADSGNKLTEEKHTNTEMPEIEVRPIAAIDGFLLAETIAYKDLNKLESVMIAKGSEVKLIGKSTDNKWYQVTTNSELMPVFVPQENVVTFTGK